MERSEIFVPFARIIRNRIWRVTSQRRSTGFEVLALWIVHRDQMFFFNKYKCCVHLDLNIVYTVSSHLLCSFRRKTPSSDQIMIFKPRRVEFHGEETKGFGLKLHV